MAEVAALLDRGRRAFTFAVIALAVTLIGMAAETIVLHPHRSPLRVGADEFSPYITIGPDGRPAGLAVDVLEEAARRSGQAIEWVTVDAGEQSLDDGRIDVFPLLAVTAGRLRRFHFSEYWWQNTLELVSLRRRPLNAPADTRNRKIGLRLKGHVYDLAKSLFPQARLVVKPGIDDLIDSLCAGEVDALFADSRTVQRAILTRTGVCAGGRLHIASLPGATVPLGTAAHRANRNQVELLYAHINEMVADSTLARIASKYQIVTPESNQALVQLLQDRERFFWLRAASVVLLCLLVLVCALGVRMYRACRVAEEAQAALADSEQRFHAFMDNATAAAFMKDEEGHFIYCNRAYYRLFGTSPDRLIGKTNRDVMPPQVAEILLEHDRMVKEEGSGREFHETVPDQLGNRKNWFACKFPFRDRSGQICLGGMAIDITAIAKAEEALRESESRYRQIVEYAGDIILRCDRRGRITYINDMGARVLKKRASQMIGVRAPMSLI
jgi:PAS domain S-box-containing protein